MKHTFILSVLVALATVSVQAQGTIKFSNNSTTKISTNSVAGGAATGITGALIPQYRFALYCSTTAASVNGGTTNVSGAAGGYAFDDANWTLVAYGSNTAAGQFVSANANSSGATTVSNVAGGDTAQFVVVGWTANNGTTITALQSWFNGGIPASSGWIGQSAVSGPITLGTSSTNAAALFGTNAATIRGFTLGLVVPSGPVPPAITTQPGNQTVAAGATATFSVGATGTPPPSYQWFFNSNAIAGATGSTLTINNAQSTNAGWYFVVITNTVGFTNSVVVSLTVTPGSSNAAPVITSQPTNQTVLVGAVASFSVGATGTPAPSYQWFFNGSNAIAGATSSIFYITNAQLSDAGRYSVLVTNIAGATNSFAATLAVTSPSTNTAPVITFQPTNQTVAAGALVRFSVGVTGIPSPSYRWSFNSNVIAGATGATLTIYNAQSTNAGWYFVVITNTVGFTNSVAVSLTVNSPVSNTAPVITSQPINQTVTAGAVARFSVGATGTSLAYQWFFNSNTVTGATSSTLSITNAQSTNTGWYFVVITNAFGSTNSFAASLTVNSSSSNTAPVITSQPSNQTVAAGATATFSVGATGTSLAYRWYFNGSNVIGGATSSTLTIYNAQSTNAGTYSVLITNAVGGTNSFAATLTVTNGVTNSTGNGYVIFANNSASIDKIYTNSAVGGPATGLTGAGGNLYYYALYVSPNATSVNGEAAPIVGGASSAYAFADTNWTLIAYGSNFLSGTFKSSGTNRLTLVPGIASGATAQFVVVGWSTGIGTNIAAVQSWFNHGSPATDGWIGQSAVSGALTLGNGGSIPAPLVLNTNAPSIQGFTLGLASPNLGAIYTVPFVPPAVLQTTITGNTLQLSWLTASGSFGVQAAPSPFGPWTDTGWAATSDGVNSVVTVTNSGDSQFYRLVPQ